MTVLEKQIQTAQHRLWLNRWFHALTFCVAIAAGLFALVVLIQRLFDAPVPLGWIALAFAVAAVTTSIIWTWIHREGEALAAARLDEAAGLQERISTGQYCVDSEDPFARSVLADAETVSGSLSVRSHIRYSVPAPLGWSALAIVIAASMFLITPGLLATEAAKESREHSIELEQAKVAVKRKMDKVRRLIQSSSAMADLEEDLGDMDKPAGGKLQRPEDLRLQGIKKIESLADAVRQKRESVQYDAVREMRKMLRGLKVPNSADAPTQKLSNALLKGDFKTAQREIEKLREQLATLKSEEDKAMVNKMAKQLNDLAKQLNKLAVDKKLAQKLKEAGLKKKDIKRLLENLKKEDIDQLKKQLQKKGLSQKQIEKLAKQLQQQQKAGSMAKKLANSMKQSAQGARAGQAGEAMAGLSNAADQLSELEKLEQEMNQLDAALADLQNAKDSLDKPCKQCGGTGMKNGKPCSACQGTGQGSGSGMGRMGRGRGGLAPEKKTDVAFKTERGKVHTGKGAIIGQFLVDGEQVKGRSTKSVGEIIKASEQEASDRINRNRIPRQFHKAVKGYFSNVQRAIKNANLKPPGSTNGSSVDQGTRSPASADDHKDEP